MNFFNLIDDFPFSLKNIISIQVNSYSISAKGTNLYNMHMASALSLNR